MVENETDCSGKMIRKGIQQFLAPERRFAKSLPALEGSITDFAIVQSMRWDEQDLLVPCPDAGRDEDHAAIRIPPVWAGSAGVFANACPAGKRVCNYRACGIFFSRRLRPGSCISHSAGPSPCVDIAGGEGIAYKPRKCRRFYAASIWIQGVAGRCP